MINSLNDINIQELLPQKPPFIMVDRLVSLDDKTVTTEFEIREDNIFLNDGYLLASGIIENIAQTCAAGIGYKNKGNSESVKIGVIGALNNFNISRPPRKDEKITTIVSFVGEVAQMIMFDAIVKFGDEELATASIRTAITDIDGDTV